MSAREHRGAVEFLTAKDASGDGHGGEPVFSPVATIGGRPREKWGPKAKDRGIDPPKVSRPGPRR